MQVLRAGPALPQQTGPSEFSHMAQVPSLTFLKLYLENENKQRLFWGQECSNWEKDKTPIKLLTWGGLEQKQHVDANLYRKPSTAHINMHWNPLWQRLSWKETKWAVQYLHITPHKPHWENYAMYWYVLESGTKSYNYHLNSSVVGRLRSCSTFLPAGRKVRNPGRLFRRLWNTHHSKGRKSPPQTSWELSVPQYPLAVYL